MAAIKKQLAYENRRFGRVNIFRRLKLRTIGAARFLKRKGKKTLFRTRTKLKGLKFGASSKRQKFLL